MNKEFFEALNILEKEKGIKKSVLIEKITKAMEVAVEKDLGLEGNVMVVIDPDKQKFGVSVVKTIVETVEDPLMKTIRQLDKLVDELAKGKTMDKILRK